MGSANAGVILLSGGGSWGNLSDRAAKANFANVDSSTILARLARIPIQSWNYKAQRPSIRHLGPMAQDFRRAFGLGEDNRYIDTLDAEGVALAGIQGLYKLSLSEQRQLAEQQREIHTLQRELRALRTG